MDGLLDYWITGRMDVTGRDTLSFRLLREAPSLAQRSNLPHPSLTSLRFSTPSAFSALEINSPHSAFRIPHSDKPATFNLQPATILPHATRFGNC
jgi:hypothetical protein